MKPNFARFVLWSGALTGVVGTLPQCHAAPVLTLEQFSSGSQLIIAPAAAGAVATSGLLPHQIGVIGPLSFANFQLGSPVGGSASLQAGSNLSGGSTGGRIELYPLTITNTGSAPLGLRVSLEEDFGFLPARPHGELILRSGFTASPDGAGDSVRFSAMAFTFPDADPNVPPRQVIPGPWLTVTGTESMVGFDPNHNYGLLFRADVFLQPGHSINLAAFAETTTVPEPVTLVTCAVIAGLVTPVVVRRRSRIAG